MGGKYDANSFTSKPHSGKYFYKKLSIPSFHTAWAQTSRCDNLGELPVTASYGSMGSDSIDL